MRAERGLGERPITQLQADASRGRSASLPPAGIDAWAHMIQESQDSQASPGLPTVLYQGSQPVLPLRQRSPGARASIAALPKVPEGVSSLRQLPQVDEVERLRQENEALKSQREAQEKQLAEAQRMTQRQSAMVLEQVQHQRVPATDSGTHIGEGEPETEDGTSNVRNSSGTSGTSFDVMGHSIEKQSDLPPGPIYRRRVPDMPGWSRDSNFNLYNIEMTNYLDMIEMQNLALPGTEEWRHGELVQHPQSMQPGVVAPGPHVYTSQSGIPYMSCEGDQSGHAGQSGLGQSGHPHMSCGVDLSGQGVEAAGPRSSTTPMAAPGPPPGLLHMSCGGGQSGQVGMSYRQDLSGHDQSGQQSVYSGGGYPHVVFQPAPGGAPSQFMRSGGVMIAPLTPGAVSFAGSGGGVPPSGVPQIDMSTNTQAMALASQQVTDPVSVPARSAKSRPPDGFAGSPIDPWQGKSSGPVAATRSTLAFDHSSRPWTTYSVTKTTESQSQEKPVAEVQEVSGQQAKATGPTPATPFLITGPGMVGDNAASYSRWHNPQSIRTGQHLAQQGLLMPPKEVMRHYDEYSKQVNSGAYLPKGAPLVRQGFGPKPRDYGEAYESPFPYAQNTATGYFRRVSEREPQPFVEEGLAHAEHGFHGCGWRENK